METDKTGTAVTSLKQREKGITATGFVGIGANLLLAGFKALFGYISGSIAITLDAVNNLSDSISSIITIVGIKIAKKPADSDHPFGHGRIEYLSAIIIAFIVFAAGVMSLIESFKAVTDPGEISYSATTCIVIAVAIVVKLLLGSFTRAQGRKYNSEALEASGTDALFDAVISAATLAAALIYIFFDYRIEGIVGGIVSVFIIKAGIEMLMQPISHIVGNRPDAEITKSIKSDIRSVEGVMGAYDLILHNYGHDSAIGSVHIEIPDTMTAAQIHLLTDHIQRLTYDRYHIILTVGIYAVNTRNDEAKALEEQIKALATGHDGVIGAHGFFMDRTCRNISFDAVFDFTIKDRKALHDHIVRDVEALCPGYNVTVNIDTNYSE